MAAGDVQVFHLMTATHGTAIEGAQRAAIRVTTITGEQQGEPDAAGGPKKIQLQRFEIYVSVWGNNPNALRALVGATAANLVFTAKGAAATETHTLKNWAPTEFLGEFVFRSVDDGGPLPLTGVGGKCECGDADTLALMWLPA